MNRVTEMKVNKIIILSRSKSSRKIEFKLYFFFSSLVSSFGNLAQDHYNSGFS